MKKSLMINGRREGFSLIEILIVVMIAVGIIAVVSNLSSNTTSLNTLVGQQLQSKSDVTQTLQILTTDIRSAEYSANGGYPIESAGTSSFVFYSDPDRDGIAERERLFLSSSTIYRGVTEPTGTPAAYDTSTEVITDLIDNVTLESTSTPLFDYYNSNYTGTQSAMSSTADVSPIRLVGMSFYANVGTVQSSTESAQGAQYFSIMVDIRNLRSN